MLPVFVRVVCRFVSGVIRRDHVAVFERLMWRACRGNVFLRHQEIEAELVDPKTVCSQILLSPIVVNGELSPNFTF